MTDEEPSPAIWTARGSALEEHDERDWAKKFGVNDAQLRKAVEKVGNQASIVEKELRAPYHPVWRRVIVFIRRSPNSNWRQAALVQEANPARPHDANVAGRRIARPRSRRDNLAAKVHGFAEACRIPIVPRTTMIEANRDALFELAGREMACSGST